MKEYEVKTVASRDFSWDAIPKAEINSYVWDKTYMPYACAKLVCVEGFGFVLKMQVNEKHPLARYTQYNEPVYTDSCMEFFADWANAGKYINMEMNSLGTLLSCCGEGRGKRVPVKELTGGEIFKVIPDKTDETWSVTAEIPFDIICKIYGCDKEIFKPGYEFRANFYKCGEDTEFEHYGSWNMIETPKPDFHRPEFFGKLIIVE